MRNLQLILTVITFKRVANLFKLLCSYYLSRISGNPVVWGMPFSVSIEPTTSCNLRCPQCPSGLRSFTRNTGMLEPETNQKIIDELAPGLSYITYYFQGEPYLNPNFTTVVKQAANKKIYTATSTNAHYLTSDMAEKTINSGLSKLIISIDGTTQQTYEQYRKGGSLEKVLTGTRNLVEARKKLGKTNPLIIWQFIVFSHNEHEIVDIQKLAKQYAVDKLLIKTAQIYDFANGSNLMPSDEKLSRYVLNGPSFSIKNKLLNHCWRMWQGCVFTWDGNVVPCCFDKDATHKMGNIHKDYFKNIWKNNIYNSFRHHLSRNRKNIDICRNCSEGTSIWK